MMPSCSAWAGSRSGPRSSCSPISVSRPSGRRHQGGDDVAADQLQLFDVAAHLIGRAVEPFVLLAAERDEGVGRCPAGAGGAGQQHGGGSRRPADAPRVHRRPHRSDDVEHRQHVGQRTALAVDVELDVIRRTAVERHQLGGQSSGPLRIERPGDEDATAGQQLSVRRAARHVDDRHGDRTLASRHRPHRWVRVVGPLRPFRRPWPRRCAHWCTIHSCDAFDLIKRTGHQ